MGLFSKLRKNKHDAAAQDSGYYTSADDQAATERARSKRASSADGAARPRGRASKEVADPVLPEKKRARRRLVGAIALAMLVAIGLPMLLDSEPKPLASDIEIKIPSKDKAPEPVVNSANTGNAASAPVAASAALDNSEEIVADPVKPAKPADAPAPKPSPAIAAPPAVAPLALDGKADVKADGKADLKAEAKAKADAKAESEAHAKAEAKTRAEALAKAEATAKAEAKTKAEAKDAERKDAERKLADAKAAKPAAKEDAGKAAEDARALAILEGKAAKPAESGQKFMIQVAALVAQDKIDEVQARLQEAGIKSFTQKVPTQSGERTRIRVGPFNSREEAEKVLAKVGKLGLGLKPSLVPV